MTRHDYLILSAALARCRPRGLLARDGWTLAVRAVAAALADQSRGFDVGRFLADCGVADLHVGNG